MAGFVVAGVVGFAADAGMLYAALALGLGPYAGRVLSVLFAIWVTWQVNRRLAFAATIQGGQSIWREWWKYLSAMLAGSACGYCAFVAVMHWGPDGPWLPLAGVVCSSLVSMVVNFSSAKWLVFTR